MLKYQGDNQLGVCFSSSYFLGLAESFVEDVFGIRVGFTPMIDRSIHKFSLTRDEYVHRQVSLAFA